MNIDKYSKYIKIIKNIKKKNALAERAAGTEAQTHIGSLIKHPNQER